MRKVEAEELPIWAFKSVDVVECEVGWCIKLLSFPGLQIDQVQECALLRFPVKHDVVGSAKQSGLHRVAHMVRLLLSFKAQTLANVQECNAPADASSMHLDRSMPSIKKDNESSSKKTP